MTEFRIKRGEVLFSDPKDTVTVNHIQRRGDGGDWESVLELNLEAGSVWGDVIDILYRHKTEPILLLHVDGFGYWGDAEFYISTDDGRTWKPNLLQRQPNPTQYSKEELTQV
jgi:hypothetical protein